MQSLHRLRLQRFPLWLALLAVLAAALLPGLAQAVRSQQPDNPAWAEICSSQGPGLLQAALAADEGLTPDPQRSAELAHLFEHCPLCLLQQPGSMPALPTVQAQQTLLRLDLSQPLPALFLHAPRPLHAWAALQPRGPPASV